MRWIMALAAALALAGCVAPIDLTAPGVAGAQQLLPQRGAAGTTGDFLLAVERVRPVAEALCRERTRGVRCAYKFVILAGPEVPANAFQTLDDYGRPVIAFTQPLIAQARNIDEIAFIIGHEAAHHILGHIPQASKSAARGAIVAGLDATLGGQDAAAVEAAEQRGAVIGARRYSKAFELQADALGTEIAFRAGFDPVRGAAFFARLPDPGNRFLGTHPPNAARIAIVRETAAGLR